MRLSERNRKILVSLLYVAAVIGYAGIVFASGGEGGGHHPDRGAQLKDLGWRVLNFAVLAGILIWAIKKANVKASLADRQVQIEKDLQDARQAKEAAESKLREYKQKLEQATKEIDEIHAAIIREGELEKERIVAEARKSAEKVAEQARLAAEQEVLKARSELRVEAARLAVEIASGKLVSSVQKNDHDRFVGEYLDKVVQIQ